MKLVNPIDHPICFAYPLRTGPSAWTQHVPFAMYLIDLLRPKSLVELGTYLGTSYCAFCQAVKELHLETHCTAVDTWQGDAHSGLYGSEALKDLRAHHDPRYKTFSHLIQSTFDEALDQFANGTIDLLHIDGYHTYHAVRHDFDSWLPKMSERGVILLHDTNERSKTFGVWKLFEEEKQHYPHFEFLHGHGLGILAVGPRYPEALRELVEAPQGSWEAVRTFFFQLGVRIEIQTEWENLRSSQPVPALNPDDLALLQNSRGVRMIKLARANRHLLSTQGPMAAAKQTMFWLTGKRQNPFRRSKLARAGYLIRKAALIFVKKGPAEGGLDVTRGIYDRHYSFWAHTYGFRVNISSITKILFRRGARETAKSLWHLLHSPSYRERQSLLLRVNQCFAEHPIMAQTALDLLQRRRANRVWKQDKDRSPFSVLFITTIGETVSARYQVDNLCEQLRKQGIQSCIIYDFEVEEHLEEALAFDVLVFQRLLMSPSIEYLHSQAREQKRALVFEVDDYLFDPSVILSHDCLKDASPQRIADVSAYSAGLREMLLSCDYFIGTTPILAQAATDLGRTSFVIRNGLSDRQVTLAKKALDGTDSQQNDDGIIRIGYQPGTLTHRQDFAVALPALLRILETFPQVKLVIQGLLEIPEALQPFHEHVESWPFVSWEKLPEVTAQLDIAIAPLEVSHPSNKAKSALKYFEAGLVAVPIVASPTEDFRKSICHGHNGFLAKTEEEWYEALSQLIRDNSLRRQIGMAARKDVVAHCTSTAQSARTLAIFETIVQEQATKHAQQLPQIPSTAGRGV